MLTEKVYSKILPSSVQSPLVCPRVTQLAVQANSPSEHLSDFRWILESYQVNTWVISGELLNHLCNVYLPKASQGRWGKSKKNKEEKRFIWCWHACLNRLYFACPKAEGIVRPSCEARLVTGRWSRVAQCEVNQNSGFQVAAYQNFVIQPRLPVTIAIATIIKRRSRRRRGGHEIMNSHIYMYPNLFVRTWRQFGDNIEKVWDSSKTTLTYI